MLLDLGMPKLNGIEVMNRLSNLRSSRTPKIIVVSEQTELKSVSINNKLITGVVNRKDDIISIYNEIKSVANNINISSEEKALKNRIIDELSYLGFNFKYKGTQYLLESIIYISESENVELLNNLDNQVYELIASNNGKTKQNVKTNIVKAANLAYIYQDKDRLKEYFSFNIKPTPKVIISTILLKI